MKTRPSQTSGASGKWIAGFSLCLATLISSAAAGESNKPDWSVLGYGGRWSENPIADIVRLRTEFRNSYVWSAAISRPVYAFTDHLSVELEINTANHSGLQHHSELNAGLLLRWGRFPWDAYVDTSVAYGLGPSYAFRKPEVEQRPRREAANLLVFMPVEVTFAPPQRFTPMWEALIRVHHRSGAYGVVSNASGSNFIAAGIRYRY